MTKANNNTKNLEVLVASEIPSRHYQKVLLINGETKLHFRKMFNSNVNKININLNNEEKIISQVLGLTNKKFDLVIISTLLYKKYIGNSMNLIFYLIDQLLQDNGILVTIHVENYERKKRFPYILFQNQCFHIQGEDYNLEIYIK